MEKAVTEEVDGMANPATGMGSGLEDEDLGLSSDDLGSPPKTVGDADDEVGNPVVGGTLRTRSMLRWGTTTLQGLLGRAVTWRRGFVNNFLRFPLACLGNRTAAVQLWNSRKIVYITSSPIVTAQTEPTMVF